MNIVLRLPLRNIRVTQPWGVNYLDFYKQWGLFGHNGIDFEASIGFKLHASHSGTVTFASTYNDGGGEPMKHVEIASDDNSFKTIYLHLSEYVVKIGDHITAGQIIGKCGNTGKYTSGPHLHFGLKEITKEGNTKNYWNGYHGAIDPTPFFQLAYDGTAIGNKDCYKSNAYHRYFRGRPKGGLQNEWRIVKELTPYLWKNGYKRLPNNEEINACTYGGWNREAIINPAMYQIWAFEKRSDYENGRIPFQN